jgi:hypothetical protein
MGSAQGEIRMIGSTQQRGIWQEFNALQGLHIYIREYDLPGYLKIKFNLTGTKNLTLPPGPTCS